MTTTTVDIGQAFLAAHLLTGSVEAAERATLAAIDSLSAGAVTEESLFQAVLQTAARAEVTDVPPRDYEAYRAIELRAVLGLARQPRRCFVLRMLAGLSPEVCARLLNLTSEQVSEHTCAALEA